MEKIQVSILTGPEGPVQLEQSLWSINTQVFREPHRSRGTGATYASLCVMHG